MINRITIGGRITADPELKQTNGGASVTSFTIACDRDFKDRDGEKGVDFITIVAWRQTAEFVCKYFAKGRMILVDGRLQVRNWKDKDGNERTGIKIAIRSLELVGGKQEQAPATTPISAGDDDDSDLPF